MVDLGIKTRATEHRRRHPRLKPDTTQLEAVRFPPTNAYRELAKAGLLPTEAPRVYQFWCLCSHRRESHPDGGPCTARVCVKFDPPCPGFRQDPAYLIEGPSDSSVRVGRGTITQDTPGESGTARLHFHRAETPGARP
jgi:hypothetical protein